MLAKIKWFQVAIILVVLTTLAVAGIFIFLIKPMNERFTAAEEKLAAQTTALATAEGKLNPAKADRVKARQEVVVAKREWARYDRALMPNIDLTNRFTATRQLWNEQLRVLGPKVLKFLYADRSVRVVSESIAIPAPVGDPNAVVQKVFTYPLGNVTVAGNFEQVLKHTERWNRFDRLALVDGLTLSGNSPTLTGTYTVTLYEITHFDKVGPAIQQATPATGGGGFPGGGGGFPGAPPGFSPGVPPSFGPNGPNGGQPTFAPPPPGAQDGQER
ncbi:MAG: hypothetical protein H8F28_11865 [Fibrella sp.]|nr:hypothetical protein [Armatimonadota bacterium]